MTYTRDRTDFPYLELPTIGLAVGLLPVSKVQFEYFLGDPAGPGRAWYDEILRVNPRASWRSVPPGDRWVELLMTGVDGAEADRFAAWLGDGFRVPTAAEWRAVDQSLATARPDDLAAILTDPSVHPAARTLAAGRCAGRPTWRSATAMDNGVLEWVRLPPSGHGLYGRPDPALYRILLDPQTHTPPRPRAATRHRAFGFRLVRPLSAGRRT